MQAVHLLCYAKGSIQTEAVESRQRSQNERSLSATEPNQAAMTSATTRQQQISNLREDLNHYRKLAIAHSEGPDGVNRRRAMDAQQRLQALHAHRSIPTKPPVTREGLVPMVITCTLLMMASVIAHGSSVKQVVSQLTAALNPVSQPSQPAPATSALSRKIEAPPAVPDPALQMASRVHVSTWPTEFDHLNAGIANYSKLSGTLARIQAVALRQRSAALAMPQVLINRTIEGCFDGLSLGLYSSRCKAIKINFGDEGLVFEQPIEVELTLAHEWGHHLIALSGHSMSAMEEEVVSDCFAGVVFGYYAQHGLMSKEEAVKALKMMVQIGNTEAHGHHPNPQVRLSSFAGGLAHVADPSSEVAGLYPTYCATLDRVIDVSKVRSLGLSWSGGTFS